VRLASIGPPTCFQIATNRHLIARQGYIRDVCVSTLVRSSAAVSGIRMTRALDAIATLRVYPGTIVLDNWSRDDIPSDAAMGR
jgi:hypothetical protein